MPRRPSRQFARNWRKSTFSSANECVEIASGRQSVLVRDSHYPSGSTLQFAPDQWSSFIRRVRTDGGILAD